ncbi:unnamed protein product [Schistosoma margrebowiei]|uniref:N-acetylglucosamine-6-phosphate deacetylase n=1 Tax=Schistosoma margrebowiei TaxID=48269 RepID=A0A183N1F5_9TREM|nr:unnamed protein product [Schistosoma margrebowiei]VDP42093.1 unnamed protein product [Schistosoma margrebowiei]
MDELSTLNVTGKIIRFYNCYLVREEHLVKDDLWIRDGIILDGLTIFFSEKAMPDILIDVGGGIISPGLIDVQVNGAYGYDFSNPDQDIENACNQVAERLPQTGVTAFCPTIITSCQELYPKLISGYQKYVNKPNCSKVLGIHLEGPFISTDCAGMHQTDYIRGFGTNPIKTISEIYGPNLDRVKMITIAPELEGASTAAAYLSSLGIVVSIGHTNCDYESAESVLSSGATFVTHLFNAMPSFHHRKAHIFGLFAGTKTPLHIGLIADLVHSHPAALRLADAISPGHVTLVTDCNTAFGLPDGSYTFGEQNIQVEAGKAYIAGTNCLAGGTTPLLTCVRNFWLEVTREKLNAESDVPKEWAGLGYALAAASTRPASVLCLLSSNASNSIHKSSSESVLPLGTLNSGSSADFIIIHPVLTETSSKPQIKLLCTWINGKPVYFCSDHHVYINIRSSM